VYFQKKDLLHKTKPVQDSVGNTTARNRKHRVGVLVTVRWIESLRQQSQWSTNKLQQCCHPRYLDAIQLQLS
jgi:hypothetical protein